MSQRRISFWLMQACGAAALLGGANARAEEAPGLTWMVPDPPAAGFFAADSSGFWTGDGKHYRSDGKLDLSVNLSPESGTAQFVASGTAGPVFLGSAEGKSGAPQAGRAGAVVTAFDPKGHELWRRPIGGPAAKGSVAVLDGLVVASNGDVVVGGQFSGCLRFDERSHTVCVDEKAARRAETCDVHGEICTEPFVASYDAKGNLKSVLAAAGYPAQWFAAAADGRIALAGAFMGKLALDPGQKTRTIVTEPESPKGHHYQTFWSTFGAGDPRWLGGYALLAEIQSAPKGMAFDSEGSLIVLALVDPLGRQGVPVTLSDGAKPVKVQPIEEKTALVVTQKVSGAPALALLPANPKKAGASLSDMRVFASPGGGVFAYGALAPPADAAFIEAPFRGHQELTVVGLDGRWKGCGIRVPEGTFTPKAVLTTGDRSCFAFSVFGQHSFKTGDGAVTFGEPRTVSAAIGCLQSPCGRKGAH
jgi:hypothetical protein